MNARAFACAVLLGWALGGQAADVERGPNGGHQVDVADKLHLELVAGAGELTLHVADTKDTKLPTAGMSARATVISAGGKGIVELQPAGEGLLKGKGTFSRSKSMKVDLVLQMPGSPPVVAKFQPMAAVEGHKHDHKGHKH